MVDGRFLAFDLGAESGRAILGTLRGDELKLREIYRFANPNGKILGRLHWNLLAQWEDLKTGLRKVAQDAANRELDGIGVDTWGVDFGLLAGDQVLGNPLMYRDGGADDTMERAFTVVSPQQIFDATGVQLMRINTLFQLLAMKQRGSKLLEAADTLLFMPDLFNFLLCGSRSSEMSIASTSQMFDPRRKQWATELLQKLGLPARILGPIVPSGTVLGALRPEVAGECAIPGAPVIAPGCHDTASAVAAVPVEQGDDWCFISSGTWSLMGVELAEPIISAKALKFNYTNEMGVGPCVRFLKNIMGLWLVQECRRHWQRLGHDYSYTELTAMAAGADTPGPLIDPDHGPFLIPGEMVHKIDRFCAKTRQPAPTDIGGYVRACLQSLALTYRKTLEGLQEILGRRIATIHIVGGGTQNELLCQMTADACGRVVIAGPVEAAAIGNILVQAMAVGRVGSLTQARDIVRRNFPVKKYEPRNTRNWDTAYARYMEIVERITNASP
jgi:rhamnulokinase